MQIDDTSTFSIFDGSDVAAIVPADVPQSFSDAWYVGNAPNPQGTEYNMAPGETGFFSSQSDIVAGDNPNIGINLPSSKALTNGFLDTAGKLLSQLRGDSGQDRNAATGRARPQKSVADLLGLGAHSGTVTPQAPGHQGMWIIVVIAAAFVVLALFGGRR